MLNNLQIMYKKVKNITLKVKPTLEVILTVPINIKQDKIDKLLNKRHEWIITQLDYFRKFSIPQKELVSGESFAYLGRNYRLKISASTNESVKLIGGYLHINLNDTTNYHKKLKLIDAWYKDKAEHYFSKVMAKYIPLVNKEVARVSIRKMKTRWGSCNPKKSYINLNLELIKKHPLAIDYVVFHELAHLIHYNHDKPFYNFIATHMPDWQTRKAKLYNIQ